MKNMKTLMVALLGLVQVTVPAGRDVATCSNICGGSNVSCRNFSADCGGGSGSGVGGGGGLLEGLAGLNAFRDRVDFNIKSASIENLGTISSDKRVIIKFPNASKQKVYSFVPTMGEQAGNKIEILLASYNLSSSQFPANTPVSTKAEINRIKKSTADYKYLIKIYRRLKGERQWLEVGDILSEKEPDKLYTLEIYISPDAIVRTSKPIGITNADGERAVLEEAVIDFGAKE